MKQQVLVIHGGTSFKSYKDYISHLQSKEVNLEKLRSQGDWKSSLAHKLGKNFEVLQPKMPNKTNARYKEWKIWLERIIPLLKKDVIFIGHSLGGIFLAKYLSENTFPKKIKATILVAPPFFKQVGFELRPSLVKFAQQGGIIYLVQSKDDQVVSFEHLEKYKKALPSAKTMIFNKRGHFKQETFPEIVKLIRTL